MQCVIVQIRCKPGKTYSVADEISMRELHSTLFSTSGEFDLHMTMYIPKDEDIGHYINEKILDVEGIERTLTTITFKAF